MDDVAEDGLEAQRLPGLDFDIGSLALGAAHHLVEVDGGVGEGGALALGAAGEEHRAHAGREADADGGDIGADELHRVVDGEARGDAAAGAVHVEGHVLLVVLAIEVEELGDDDVRDHRVDGRAEEDDALLEEEGVDVVGALAASIGLDDEGHDVADGIKAHVGTPGGSPSSLLGPIRANNPGDRARGERAG